MPYTLVLITMLAAHAAPSLQRTSARDCGLSRASLPDPFEVDVRDAPAILLFVDLLIGLPTVKQPEALDEALTKFWLAYRPDHRAAEIKKRVEGFGFGSFALRTIRGNRPAARTERGRLRLAWITILRDLAGPSNSPPDANQEERARSLSMPASATVGEILARCSHLNGRTIDAVLFPHALRAAYARDLPHETPPSLRVGGITPPRDIKSAWFAYLDALDRADAHAVKLESGAPPRSKYMARKAVATPGANATSEEIVTFLAARYREILIATDGALAEMLGRLRADKKLPLRENAIGRGDLKLIIYDRSPQASARLQQAWAEYTADLEAQRAAKRKKTRDTSGGAGPAPSVSIRDVWPSSGPVV